jgi:hemoglobin
MTSLYESLGGEAAVTAAVDIFYRKVLADELLAPFFSGVDMERQAAKQRAFLTVAMGGPNKYTGRGMRAAHARSVEAGLSDAHFDAVVGHLAATLRELGVTDDKIAEAGAIVETTRDQVLGRAGAA